MKLLEIGALEASVRRAGPLLRRVARQPTRLPAVVGKAALALWRGGLQGFGRQVEEKAAREGTPFSYLDWVRMFDALADSDRAAITRRIAALPARPLFSVLMPLLDWPEPLMRRAIESLTAQLYPGWELCIACTPSIAPLARLMIEDLQTADGRIRLAIRETDRLMTVGSNAALDLARGEFVTRLHPRDELAPHALYLFAEELAVHPDADLLYADEDHIDEAGARFDPCFKPDWNPDLFTSQHYISRSAVYRTRVVRGLGAFREAFEGSEEYDLGLRIVRATKPEGIRHLPHVLYHQRSGLRSTGSLPESIDPAETAGLRALQEAVSPGQAFRGPVADSYRVRWQLPEHPPLVTVIVPTRDGGEVLRRCVESVLERTIYPHLELLVIDNGSRDPATLAFLRSLRENGRARVFRDVRPFNFSALNNAAVREARGTIVCLLNDDVQVITPEWLSALVAQALRPGVGAVGARLLYPDGTVQHAGVIVGLGVAAHLHRGIARSDPGYFGRALLAQNFCAVTAACMVVRKEVYERAGGLDETHLAVAFNDVDFCLRLVEEGLRNVYEPAAELFHHESLSRGTEDTRAKRARFARESAYMLRRWKHFLAADPCFNPNLSVQSALCDLAWPPRAPKPWKGRK